jgi:hypothetical protein
LVIENTLRDSGLSAFYARKKSQDILLVKKAIWLYFFLLIFEGALRKWFLPFLATPLLIVREPIAIYIVFLCIKNKLFPQSAMLSIFVITGFISIFLAIFLGHQNLFVALFGARVFLLHIPVMFVMGYLFSQDDIFMLGKVMLWLTIIMAVIIFLQFYSPQSAWINRGIGGDEAGAGYQGALGYMRPPGTFSFTNGTTSFFSFAAPFIVYFLFNKKYHVNKFLLYGATLGLLIAVPLSISRALLFNVVLVVIFLLIISLRSPKVLAGTIAGAAVLAIVILVLAQIESIGIALDVFTARFDTASAAEGGIEGALIDRFLGGMMNALFSSTDIPFWGLGVGMGSKVGAMLLTGSRGYLLPEGEWGRVIGELGIILGLTVIFLRISMSFSFLIRSYKLAMKNNPMAWLLMSTGFVPLLQGQWGQPTNLGFYIITGGVIMATIRGKGTVA